MAIEFSLSMQLLHHHHYVVIFTFLLLYYTSRTWKLFWFNTVCLYCKWCIWFNLCWIACGFLYIRIVMKECFMLIKKEILLECSWFAHKFSLYKFSLIFWKISRSFYIVENYFSRISLPCRCLLVNDGLKLCWFL